MQTVPNFLIKGLGKERKGEKINVFEFFAQCLPPLLAAGRLDLCLLPSSPVFGRKIQLGFTAAPLKFMGKPAPWRGEDGERGPGRMDDGVSAIDPPPSSFPCQTDAYPEPELSSFHGGGGAGRGEI